MPGDYSLFCSRFKSISMKQLFRSGICQILAMVIIASASYSQEFTLDEIKPLQFRHIGPIGNRLISVTGIPGDPLTYYVGAASGGIWKTVDGGINWSPVFDKQPVHSIGALAAAPSDPEVIYAGTGEAFIRSNISIGNGMWKSTDGGSLSRFTAESAAASWALIQTAISHLFPSIP